MSQSLSKTKVINANFNELAAEKPAVKKSQNASKRKKRRSPLTIRLTDEQWEDLEQLSQGISYGAYAKECMFNKKRSSKRSAVQDYEMLARVLAALGQTELFGKLDHLIALSEKGELDLSPDAEFQLGLACACVIEMRDNLIEALGIKPKD
ncbi:hypothetical protein [uncultured Cohaesibacter sp.]|uniref:hypothetical protein n=1 Tax=uncultured Cohaesibacter sp. TaxID=1002546 RepID=UPI002AA6FA7F|nr:hypothetical protein [uncultured Cohaesibacter sp.]